MASRRIVIAGAGIGGLTAALALGARGFSVLILERAAALQPIGAGVQLSPNASRILIGLGLRDALHARATSPSAVVLNSTRAGGECARLPLPQTDGAPYWVIHRADLQAALTAAVLSHPNIELRLDSPVRTFVANDCGICVACRDEAIEAEALIAADGVASPIRGTLFPEASACASGRVAWRGLADVASTPEVNLWMAPDAHLVTYPVAGGQTNLVLTRRDDGLRPAGLTGEAAASELRSAGWPDAAVALIRRTQEMTPYPLFTVPPVAAWNLGRVALLGDAAHAMLPFAAQGAAMAIEDAAVLASCMSANDDVPAALRAYSQARRARVARVAATAAQSGRIYHVAGPMALARDTAIRLLGGSRLLARHNWIYDWTP